MKGQKQANQYLATESIGKLMLKFSVPCIISLLVSALYNIVDQIFIGHGVGYLGNGATNVVFPITVIALAIALLIGDGCTAFFSICQGKRDEKNSHRCVGNAIVLVTIIGITITILFVILKYPILRGFGATENNIGYAVEYFEWLVIGIPFFMFSNAMNSIIRADGNPRYAMIATLAGCIVNVILDPIAIFVLDWGMAGAAIATVMGQILSAVLTIIYFKRAKSFKLMKNSFKLRKTILARTLPLGISSFLTQVSIVCTMAVMNNTLVHYGMNSKYGADIPLTVMGIVMKVFQIVIAFSIGIGVGAQPLVGYNYGAGLKGRVKKILKVIIIAEVGIGIIATVIFQIFPLQIISIFGSEEGLYNEFAVIAFRVFLAAIALCCIQKASSIFLQSIGKPVLAMGLSLLRDFILIIPLILILPRFGGVTATLYSGLIADVIAFAATVILMVYINKKELKTEVMEMKVSYGCDASAGL